MWSQKWDRQAVPFLGPCVSSFFKVFCIRVAEAAKHKLQPFATKANVLGVTVDFGQVCDDKVLIGNKAGPVVYNQGARKWNHFIKRMQQTLGEATIC